MKREQLAFLADNPLYTKRFAFYVGRRCRQAPIKDIAHELMLDWDSVKTLEMQYMRAQLAKAGTPAPKAIGIDEISIRKGHTYRIVVSDLIRRRPIWFGGEDRSEASMTQFYAWLGENKARHSACGDGHVEAVHQRNPQTGAAGIHPVRQVPHHAPPGRSPRQSAQGGIRAAQRQEPSLHQGPKYTLLSRRENLTLEGRRSLKTLLSANKRLNTAYLLKESFGQLWDYEREGWARRFFENWRASLKWQRLKPYEKFAEMIDRHWDGIAAYCRPENKVSLGFVEALNNKIRVIQRRAYGLRDEEYLRLKILTCMLPAL